MKKNKPKLIVSPDQKIISHENYIFLSKYLQSFYKRKNLKKFKIINSDKYSHKNSRIKKNFNFALNKLKVYRSELSEKLNKYHNLNYSVKYWGIIIDMWLFNLITILKIRSDIVKETRIFKKDISLDHKSLENFFPDSSTFILDTQKGNLEEYYYGKIIYFLKNKKKFSNSSNLPEVFETKKINKEPFSNKIINQLKILYLKLFKPVVCYDVYFGKKNALQVILKSLGKIIFFKNLNAEYNNDASDKNFRKKIKIKEREEFDKIFNLFLNELLPKSYLENYRNIKNNNLIKNMIENSKKICTSQPHHNDELAIIISEIKEIKKKFIIFQHGAYFGLVENFFREKYDRNYGDSVLYWNNKSGLGDNYLSKFKTRKKKKYLNILFLCSPTRFCPMTTTFEPDINNNPFLSSSYKIFSNIKPNLRKIFLVKPFPIFYSLETQKNEWLKNTKHQIKFTYDKKDIYNSKILIVDNFSTAFFEAIRADVPIIINANIKKFGFKKKYQKIFIDLKKLEMIQENISSLSKFLNQNYHNLDKWWDKVKNDRAFKTLQKNLIVSNPNFTTDIVKYLL